MSAPQGFRMPFGRLRRPATVLGKAVTSLLVVALVAAVVVYRYLPRAEPHASTAEAVRPAPDALVPEPVG